MPSLAVNKNATFDYETLEKFEAGIELNGFEVKAVAAGRVNASGAYAVIKDDEAWLLNLDIPPYQPNNTPANYNSKRSRRLLLHKKEIAYLTGKAKEKQLTMILSKLYNKNGKIKAELLLSRHRKARDKREMIKKRETEREIRRTVL